MKKRKLIPEIARPSPEELYEASMRRYEADMWTFMDNWTKELHALSIPSLRIELNDEMVYAILKMQDTDKDRKNSLPKMQQLAQEIDNLIGWEPHFVRLNTRSPKDMTSPDLPITHSGKVAAMWLASSMRTFDDLCLLHGARKPAYVYLREVVHIAPQTEFRVFVKNCKPIGGSQYHYGQEFQYPDGFRKTGWEAMSTFAHDVVLDAVPDLDTFVVDLWFPDGVMHPDNIRVIEINPYNRSDPCGWKTHNNMEIFGGLWIKGVEK